MRDEARALLTKLAEQAEDGTLRKQARRQLSEMGRSIPFDEREKPDDPTFVWPD